MDEPHRTHRRQQRRRATIAWITAGLAVVLIVLGAVFGGEDERGTVVEIQPFGFSMTAAQYSDLQAGLDEAEFLNRLEQTGSPEEQTPERVVALFPPHEADFNCSYWQIVDRAEQLARVCFDRGGELAQKLERGAFEEPSGVNA